MWFFHSDFFSLGKSFTLAIDLQMVWASLHFLCFPSAYRGQPPTDSQCFNLDPWGSFQVIHSGQWTCPTGFWQSFGWFGISWHRPGHAWWNDLWPPGHFLPGFSQAPGTSNWGGPTLRGCVAMMFLRGAFCCLALKARHGWHFATCPFTCAAMWGQKNLSCMTSNMCSRPRWPTSSWHPLRATSLYAVGKTSWRRVSSNSLGLACLYGIPFIRTRWFHSHPNWMTLGASVALDWLFPSIPSLSLEITRLRMGSPSWA